MGLSDRAAERQPSNERGTNLVVDDVDFQRRICERKITRRVNPRGRPLFLVAFLNERVFVARGTISAGRLPKRKGAQANRKRVTEGKQGEKPEKRKENAIFRETM